MAIAKFKTKKKQCNKGWGCGLSCISKAKGCRITAKAKSKELLNALSSAAGAPMDKADIDSINSLIKKKSWSQEDTNLYKGLAAGLSLEQKVDQAVELSKAGKEDKINLLDNDINRLTEENFKVEEPNKPGSNSSYTPNPKYIRPDPLKIEKAEADKQAKEVFRDLKANYKGVWDLVYKPKTEKAKKDGMSPAESLAISQWVSQDYDPINRMRLQQDWTSANKFSNYTNQMTPITNSFLNDAIAKAPKFNEKDAQKEINLKGFEKTSRIGQEYPLVRGLDMSPDAAVDFLKRRKMDSLDNSGITSTDTFEAFTWDDNIVFDGNIKVMAKPLDNGKTKAGMVDKYKNKLFESEALYPTGTKFKIDGITVTGLSPEESKKLFDNLEFDEDALWDHLERGKELVMYVTEVE